MHHSPTERPLSFATDMLRAVRDGAKQQTRRPVYPQNVESRKGKLFRADGREVVCPFGVPGDRLWVRERFAFVNGDAGEVVYSADPVKGRSRLRWQQSRYLPRAASRVLLQVKSIRAERLQTISVADARGEGYPADSELSPVDWFHRLWDRLTTAEPLRWAANPWVWVVKFAVIEGALSESAKEVETPSLFNQEKKVPTRGVRSATLEEKRKLAAMLKMSRR